MEADMTVKLLVVQGRPLGKSLLFPVGEYYFGRGPECQVRPESEWVSRQHCLLRVTAEGGFVRDLGSRNGTLVNGCLVENERQLLNGDQVQIGPLVFEVQLETETVDGTPGVTQTEAVTLGAENTAEMDLTQQPTSTLYTGKGGVLDTTKPHLPLPAKLPPPS
jgi:pSer/pThr/pTyr-binding forkhead associated (FHA) protein